MLYSEDMTSPDKIRLMTELSLLEEKKSRKLDVVRSFFRIDYVGKHMLGAFFRYTVAFLMVFLLGISADLEGLLDSADVMAVFGPFGEYLIYYLAGLVIYELITFLVYMIRYENNEKLMRSYQSKLKRLRKRYNAEGQIEAKAGEAGKDA